MKLNVKPMPAVMTVLSALYFFYVLTSEDTVLSADAVGGDPGGKVLPLTMAVFMFIGFLYLTVKERPEKTEVNPETRRLFLLTLILSVAYIFLIRPVGFVITSTVLVFWLEYIYTTIGEERSRKQLAGGMAGTLGITVVFYVVMRMITKTLLRLGGSGALPGIFAVTTFEACISFVYVAVLSVVLNKTLCRRLDGRGLKRVSGAGLLTMTTVLFLYVVFKQFFNVNLAPGILNI